MRNHVFDYVPPSEPLEVQEPELFEQARAERRKRRLGLLAEKPRYGARLRQECLERAPAERGQRSGLRS